MIKKTELAKQAMQQGNIKEALRLAKGFKLGLSKEDKKQLERGYEMFVRPDFYKSLGYDKDAEISKAVEIFNKYWG